MEIEVDKRVKDLATIVIGVIAIGVIIGLLFIAYSNLTAPKPPPAEKQVNYTEQMELIHLSICGRQDAIQMWIQEPQSKHPQVLKLREDISIYNKLAANQKLKLFSPRDC